MREAKANNFWEQRSSQGRKPIFESPDDLWQACCEYFTWVEENPLDEIKPMTVAKGGNEGSAIANAVIPHMRAMTLSGLCIFLDISQQAWYNYAARSGFVDVTTRAYEIIRTQKFEGAAGGFLNPVIIARDLGLSDTTRHTGHDGGPVEVNHAPFTIARAIAEVLERGAEDEETDK